MKVFLTGASSGIGAALAQQYAQQGAQLGLFARRAFNIFSLAVSPTDEERFSRMTIVVDA